MKPINTVREGLTNIAGWAFVIILMLGGIIVYGVGKARAFNIYILLIGLFLIVFGLVALWIVYKIEFRDYNKKLSAIKRLKSDGFKIEVQLDRCQIVNKKNSENWLSENGVVTASNGSEIKVIYEKTPGASNKLIYSVDIDGKKVHFVSQPIYHEMELLKMLLDHQKTTHIFMDKTNPNNYYFDIEFL